MAQMKVKKFNNKVWYRLFYIFATFFNQLNFQKSVYSEMQGQSNKIESIVK